MSSPVVAGAAALLLQVNPNLTPNMVKMILQYSAQPIPGANMLEQGAGQLNIEGAVRLAKSFNPSMNFQTATNGTSIVPTGWVAPTPTSSIGGTNVAWSQMITTNYAFITGQSLISKYQGVYALGNNFDDGVISTAGVFSLNSTKYSPELSITSNIITSNGGTLGSGTVYAASDHLFRSIDRPSFRRG